MDERDLSKRLRAWVAHGVISSQQADDIAAFEAGRRPTAPSAIGPSLLQPSTETPPARRIPVAIEVLGYSGGVLVLGALLGLLVPSWERIGSAMLTAIAGFVTVALLVAGWVFAATKAVQSQRLGHFLLFLGALVSGAVFALITDLLVIDPGAALVALVAAGGVFALSLVLWFAHKTALELIAATLSLAAVIGALCNQWLGASDWLMAGLAYLLLGGLWMLAADRDWLKPKTAAWDLGALEVVAGVQITTIDSWRHNGWVLFLGCVVSAALLVVSLWRDRRVPLGIGAAGLVMFIPETLYWVFEDSLGVPAAVLIAGVLLVALSVFLIVVLPRLRARRVGQAIGRQQGISNDR